MNPSLKRTVRHLQRLEDRTVPATFQVTNTANAGAGSLRQAILSANATAGADTIVFAIGTGAQRIQPTAALPTITDTVTVDGTTQPGFAGTPLIEVDFNNLAGLVLGTAVDPDGPVRTSSGSVIRSLSLVNSGPGTPAVAVQTNQNLIAGCYVGLQPNGSTVVANREGGIIVTGNSNTIGGPNAADANVISGNQDTTPTATGGNGGIEIVGDSTAISATGVGNTVINNTVGANPAGVTAIGNQYVGIELRNGARTNTVTANRVYASTIVTALGGIGIGVRGLSNNNTVTANTVGSIFNALGNPGSGIYLSLGATTNFVTNNVVAGNGDGLRFEDAGTSANSATGNQIFGSVANGILIRGAAAGNTAIGGNAVSGNAGFGALITDAGTAGNALRGNDFVNNALGGVRITAAAANNQVGGTARGQGNTFVTNGPVQVLRDASAGNGNAVLGNNFDGTVPVIDNTPDTLVPVPFISTVTTFGGGTTVQGFITGVAGRDYRFEIYDSAVQAGGGVSQGGSFLGAVEATADINGDATFTFRTGFVGHGRFYSATATDLTLNNTSEFSLVTAERIFAAGAGPGGLPLVKVFNTDGTVRMQFLAYDAAFNGGVHVATADFDGDLIEDIITGAGFGGGPNVKVYSGVDGSLLFDVMAYEPEFTGGVWVAGDDSGLIATGPGEGGGPLLRVFNPGGFLTESFVYDLGFRGGVTVAFTQDIDGDGFDDILTGAGAGGAPHVKAFSFTNPGVPTVTQVTEFFALDPNSRSGVVVSGGDFNGDGFGDVLTAYGFGSAQFSIGPVPDGFPRNIPYSPVATTTDPRAQSYVFDLGTGTFVPQAEAFPFGLNAGVGVFVASEDLDGDGTDDGIYGRALGSPDVIVLDGVNGFPFVSLPNVFPGRGGVFVG